MRRAFTLMEMIIVVIILAILAAIIVPMLGGLREIATPTGPKSDKQIVTETTMRAIRDAILGTDSRPGAWPDLGQRPDRFPTDPNLLLHEFSVIQALDPSVPEYDPVTKIGWRGPYLQSASTLVDAWGNPILIDIIDVNSNNTLDLDDLRYVRLVSFGEDGSRDTPLTEYLPGDGVPASELTLDDCGDDIVLFFRVADTRQ